MTTHKEALTLALEALEEIHVGNMTPMDEINWNKAITAIKEALAKPELCKYGQEPKSCTSSPMDCQCALDATFAQPEQEPVAYTNGTDVILAKHWTADYPPEGWKPLGYTTTPQRKPLTLGQKQRLWSSLGNKPTLKDRVNAFGLAIEAAHGIKGEA